MKAKYDPSVFRANFSGIILNSFGIDASLAKYSIIPVYNPDKGETGEDSVYRLVFLSEDNIGGKKSSFDDALSILTAFESHYPTKIELSKIDSSDTPPFEIKCSTRGRKPSAIAGIDRKYAPFTIADPENDNV
ncbi:MAG: hypothetical protein K6G71_03160 [Clostridiales bacterium]|nr:hypothetical protein [Clostridiales bacterium]